MALETLLATVPFAAFAQAVPSDIVQMAVQARSADPGGTAATLASCWADSVHTAAPRLQFCLAYEVAAASGGNASDSGIGGMTTAERESSYLARLGVPAAARQSEIDRIRGMISPASVAVDKVQVGDTYKGRLTGGRGTLTLDKTPEGAWHVGLSVSGHGCAGHVEGTAREDGNAISLLRASDGEECSLTITRGAGTVTIVENQCPIFHGGSCDFNGKLKLAR
jgi:hypothetical protein